MVKSWGVFIQLEKHQLSLVLRSKSEGSYERQDRFVYLCIKEKA